MAAPSVRVKCMGQARSGAAGRPVRRTKVTALIK